MEDAGEWIWILVITIGPLLLGLIMLYGAIVWRRRRRTRLSEAARNTATQRVYQEPEP